ncbi:MAG: hypothetical protein V4616_01935 [Bacteroidota bacterium]
MKQVQLFLATALIIGSVSVSAQSKPNTSVNRKVEYSNNNGKQTLTIVTRENGKEKKEVYTGDEANAKMQELNDGKNSNNFQVWTEDEASGSPNGSVHVSHDDGEVSVIHKDGKMIIKKIDENGKEEIEEIEMGQMLNDIAKDFNFTMDSTHFSFDSKNFDSKEFQKQMEKLEKHLEDPAQNSTSNSRYTNRSGTTVVRETEETLTPAELKKKYGVEGAEGETVIIKKVIRVRKK